MGHDITAASIKALRPVREVVGRDTLALDAADCAVEGLFSAAEGYEVTIGGAGSPTCVGATRPKVRSGDVGRVYLVLPTPWNGTQ